jgi:hypothetical protein
MLGVRNPAELLWTAPRRRAPGPGDRIPRASFFECRIGPTAIPFLAEPFSNDFVVVFFNEIRQGTQWVEWQRERVVERSRVFEPRHQASRAAYHHQDIARQHVQGRWRRRWVIHEPRHVGGKRARPQM